MPGLPVSFGCTVVISPGAAGPPDTGTIVGIFPPYVMANSMPLATMGSMCLMVNSLSGVPYATVIGPGGSTAVFVSGKNLVRIGDMIPTPPGILTVIGPPATTSFIDQSPP